MNVRWTYRFPRVGGDAAALEPRHDATSFLALKHMIEQTRKDGPDGGGLSHSRYHVSSARVREGHKC